MKMNRRQFRKETSIERNLRLYIQKTDSCWFWTGPLTEKGYGKAIISIDGVRKDIRAHRLVYEHLIGSIPQGFELDHRCRVKNCVNPDHILLKTKSVHGKESALLRWGTTRGGDSERK